MFRKLTGIRGSAALIFFILVAMVILAGCVGSAPASGASTATPAPLADPQHLLIPRWFLSSLTLDGQEVAIADDQQAVTIQFSEDGSVNGTGGCNDFGTTYTLGADGKLEFGPVTSTKMACEQGMDIENAYFQALEKVERFSTENFRLVLSSADGKTSLTFRMPPK